MLHTQIFAMYNEQTVSKWTKVRISLIRTVRNNFHPTTTTTLTTS